jgi:unconventional prefoldin RPB5 interactor 1
MAETIDNFVNLERHRQLLEQNVDKLSEALVEWRQWKTEYEALKKSVQSLPSDAPRKNIKNTRQSFRGDLVDNKVLAEIFGKDDAKKAGQVLSVLTNRIDYVSKNIATLEKQLVLAENKLAAANVISNPEATDDDGLPITEIVEELDDDDNVVSFSLRTPGNSQPQLLEALEKAGLKDLVPSNSIPEPMTREQPKPTADGVNDVDSLLSPARTKAHETPKPKPKKKGVTFADDTKPGTEQQKFKTAGKVDDLMRQAKDQENIISEPVVPSDESEADAQLRRDMLQYNLSELNPVVAELLLEEGDITDDDFGSDTLSEYEDDDDEDQWGRSTSTIMSDEYRQKMLEIQERMKAVTFGTPDTCAKEESDDEDLLEGIGRIHVKKDQPSTASASSTSLKHHGKDENKSVADAKKSVRFAQALDISELPVTTLNASSAPQPPEVKIDPLSDVVEREAPEPPKNTTVATKKASRFKTGRKSDGPSSKPIPRNPAAINGSLILPEQPMSRPIAPSGPEGQTMTTAILEREPSSTPHEPDELDAGLLEQQVAVEYHKMRNKMIQKQGGFMKEDESPVQLIDKEEGGPIRVSRFRAARLAKP